ncbi:MAG: antibiotic resistance protein MarC [Candidatus Fluviicola riflensis]|nr:MAG: stress protection protein MarC [Candidatus Fluviicola riflensis]OGS78791.1 MAG: antibiotic resistance protein MarC [Candidatus Fluviicola riflensis]OGS86222.1 MAG: antibiotic resistance protein MarC [Fluviicola sp. RIFCSPHIGHO2_01_FULL_43_53]OGS87664.1 MAG: antibiotic resistance protein MarC [Fluviicola sp. RIFCSPHIGHO2_12_FULL_43_24]
MELFITIFAALFSVINPLGTVPVFVGLTKDDSKHHRDTTSMWTAVNVFVILIISFFAGKYVLDFFGISLNSLRMAGGLIITTSGFALLTGSFTRHKGMKKASVQQDLETRSEVSLTPLAIPMLAGPGSISLLINYNQSYTGSFQILIAIGAIIAVCALVYLILRTSHYIVKVLGASGINAISRIIGFIVIAIGIEYITGAVLTLLEKKC